MATVFPVKPAYDCAAENDLAEDAERIRQLPRKPGFRYMTSARRGYMIELFERKGLLDAFLRIHWPEGLESTGRKTLASPMRPISETICRKI